MERTPAAALTPTEEMVLGFIRAGAMDAEIAVRIGCSIADVKARVASLLAKAGADERVALRTWEPATAAAGSGQALPVPPGAAPRGAARARSLSPLVGLAVVAVLAVSAAWALVEFRGRGGERTASKAPAATADIPNPPLVAAVTAGVQFRLLQFDAVGIGFPGDIALLLKEGCDGCVGEGRVTRIYRGPGGEIERDVLFEVEVGSRLLSVRVDPRGARIALTEYRPGTRESIVWRSLDGGVRWDRLALLEGEQHAVAIIGDDVLAWEGNGVGWGVYRRLPSDEPYASPVPSGQPLPYPLGGQVTYRGPASTLVRSDGTTVLDAPIARGALITNLHPYPHGDRLLLELTALLPQATIPYSWLATVDRDGALVAGFTNAAGPIVAVYAPGLAIGRAPLPSTAGRAPDARNLVPAVIDLAKGIVYPIMQPFGDAGFGRYVVVGVARGPFARVSTAGSECVPIYDVPGGGPNRQRDCLHDRVLVRHGAGEHQVNDTSWLGVITPSGVFGYIDAGFLERAEQ
ncbi:MAG: hypothetical protein ACR2HN_03275 [Tepidiformaceae bacterium]